MSKHARVVVIGGGIMGTSALYHLAAEGWTDVLLCEKAELTSGSTWHAAGLCSHTVMSQSIGWIANYSIKLYRRLEQETNQSVSWHGSGGIRLVYNQLEHDWAKYQIGLGRCMGFPMEFIGLDEVKRLNPLFNPEGAVAALRTYGDGHVDPAGACHAMAKAARALGATIERHNRVVGVRQRPNGEWQVGTEKGTIVCEHVINAAGCYGRQVGEWMGVEVPLAPILHTYVVTEPVPALDDLETEIPIMRDDTYRGYIRQEQRSLLIGVYENRGAKPVWTDGPPWDSEHELFDPDYDVIGPWLEGAFYRMPVAEKLGIRRVVRGAITHTPDGSVLLGPAPGVRSAWLATGSLVGIAWGGGMGRLLAQWIVHDDTEVNVRAFDPRRFGSYASHEWIVEKSKEDYQVRHDTPVPGLQRPALRPWRRSSIHDRLEAHGAVFGEVHGYERPRWFARDGGPDLSSATAVGSRLQDGDANGWRRQPWFETVGQECRAVRERVGLFDLTAFTKIEITGRDAEALLARLVANRLPKRTGGIVLAHALTRAGTIGSEFTITRIDADRFYLCSSAIAELKDLDRLRMEIREGEDVHIENISSSWGCIMIAGPKTRDVLEIGTDAGLSDSAFRWLTGRDLALFDAPCRLLRVSYTGELGFEIHLPVEHMLSVYDALWEVGEPHGIMDFGSHALNSLRMEKGYKGGTELTSEVSLPEADMLRFANFDKDDFIGKAATLSRIQKGLRWLLVYLEVDSSDADCIGIEPVYAGDRKIGATSSGGYGYATEKSFAFAYVDPDYATPDTELAVQILGDKRRARILGAPAYDPENARLRS